VKNQIIIKILLVFFVFFNNINILNVFCCEKNYFKTEIGNNLAAPSIFCKTFLPVIFPEKLSELTEKGIFRETKKKKIYLREDVLGKKWVLKESKEECFDKLILNEYFANKIYKSLGVNVPQCKLYFNDEKLCILCEFIEGKSLGDEFDMKTKETFLFDYDYKKDIKSKFKKTLVRHAFLFNFDAVGGYGRNVIVGKQKEIWFIDSDLAVENLVEEVIRDKDKSYMLEMGSIQQKILLELDSMRSISGKFDYEIKGDFTYVFWNVMVFAGISLSDLIMQIDFICENYGKAKTDLEKEFKKNIRDIRNIFSRKMRENIQRYQTIHSNYIYSLDARLNDLKQKKQQLLQRQMYMHSLDIRRRMRFEGRQIYSKEFKDIFDKIEYFGDIFYDVFSNVDRKTDVVFDKEKLKDNVFEICYNSDFSKAFNVFCEVRDMFESIREKYNKKRQYIKELEKKIKELPGPETFEKYNQLEMEIQINRYQYQIYNNFYDLFFQEVLFLIYTIRFKNMDAQEYEKVVKENMDLFYDLFKKISLRYSMDKDSFEKIDDRKIKQKIENVKEMRDSFKKTIKEVVLKKDEFSEYLKYCGVFLTEQEFFKCFEVSSYFKIAINNGWFIHLTKHRIQEEFNSFCIKIKKELEAAEKKEIYGSKFDALEGIIQKNIIDKYFSLQSEEIGQAA
jgi:hypothetical protein